MEGGRERHIHRTETNIDWQRGEYRYTRKIEQRLEMDCVESERERFYLTTHSTHFILRLYGARHMVKDHSDSTRCRLIGYSYRLTARVLLYAQSHRQDNTYHGLCYTSRGALAGTRNRSMGPPHEGIDPTTHRTMSERSYL